MNIGELLASASLPDSDTPLLDAELLLAHCLGRNRSYLRAFAEREVDVEAERKFRALLARRARGEPVAHLIGLREFWSLPLDVDASTLIPRPDTERLVEVALQLCDDKSRSVLDLGTGSGAIALALASERPAWSVCGVDRSPDAVALAQRNAHKLTLQRIEFIESDWFAAIESSRRFDLIVANPPYIAADDPHLVQGDLRFEPRTALVAESDGLADIALIAAQAPAWLNGDGWLLLEHGWQQAAAVRALLQRYGFVDVQSWRDYGDNERVTGGRRR
jgi:release factor glutamine methyltransferase